MAQNCDKGLIQLRWSLPRNTRYKTGILRGAHFPSTMERLPLEVLEFLFLVGLDVVQRERCRVVCRTWNAVLLDSKRARASVERALDVVFFVTQRQLYVCKNCGNNAMSCYCTYFTHEWWAALGRGAACAVTRAHYEVDECLPVLQLMRVPPEMHELLGGGALTIINTPQCGEIVSRMEITRWCILASSMIMRLEGFGQVVVVFNTSGDNYIDSVLCIVELTKFTKESGAVKYVLSAEEEWHSANDPAEAYVWIGDLPIYGTSKADRLRSVSATAKRLIVLTEKLNTYWWRRRGLLAIERKRL